MTNPDPLAVLRDSLRDMREAAIERIYREAMTVGLLGDPFVEAIIRALGEISLDEAL